MSGFHGNSLADYSQDPGGVQNYLSLLLRLLPKSFNQYNDDIKTFVDGRYHSKSIGVLELISFKVGKHIITHLVILNGGPGPPWNEEKYSSVSIT